MVTLEDVAAAVLSLDQKIDRQFNGVREQFNSIDQKFDGIDQRFDGIDGSLQIMQRQTKGLELRFNKFEIRFDKFEKRFSKHEAYTEGLDTLLAKLEANTRVTATVVAEHGRDIAELKVSRHS